MNKQSLKINLLMNIIVMILGMIFPLITFPYVSRILGPTGIGAVSYATSITSYFSIIALLGVNTYGIKACSEVREDKSELSKVVIEIMCILFFSAIVSYAILFFLIEDKIIDTKFSDIICIYSIEIALQVVGMEWLYKALEKYTFIAIRSIIIKCISLVLMFAMVKEKNDYPFYAIINVLADGGAQLINLIFSFKYLKVGLNNKLNIKRHLSPLLTFFFTNVVHLIYTNLDIIMLENKKGIYEVGIYNMSLRIENILLSMVAALGVVILPKLTLAIKEKKFEEFKVINKKANDFTVVFALAMIGLFEVMSPEIVSIIGGNEYQDSVISLRIILPVLLIAGIANVSGLQTLIPLGKEKVFLFSVFCGAVVNFVLNYIFIDRFGSVATAISTLIAEIIVWLIQIIYLHRISFGIPKMDWKPFLICIMCSILIFVINDYVLLYNMLIKSMILGIVYFMAWILFSILFKEKICIEIIDVIKWKLLKPKGDKSEK